VGRAQELLYYIHLLKVKGSIPDVPVYLNSPMAIDATEIFNRHRGEHRLSASECEAMFHTAHMVNTVEQSKALNENRHPMIILAASGMASGGRVVHLRLILTTLFYLPDFKRLEQEVRRWSMVLIASRSMANTFQ
jgi:metallo-beta-lactamase family protein